MHEPSGVESMKLMTNLSRLENVGDSVKALFDGPELVV